MSNHHSKKSINLHHEQVNAGKVRQQQRQDERHAGYLTRFAAAQSYQLYVAVLSVICFGYTMIALAVNLGYIL